MRRWRFAVVVPATLVAGFALGEWLGWPFLASPLQNQFAKTLERQVHLITTADPNKSGSQTFSVRFVGGVRFYAPQLEISAPVWSRAPHMVLARDVSLELRYADLWRAFRGHPLRIHRLQAGMLDGHLERLADGRASWQFKPAAAEPVSVSVPAFDYLQVSTATLRYRDELFATDVSARASLVEDSSLGLAPSIPVDPAKSAANRPANGLQATATGRFRDQALKLDLTSSGVMPWLAEDAPAPVPLTLNATVGRAHLRFEGGIVEPRQLTGINGHFSLNGKSLAAVGGLFGVTLPTTAEFRSDGIVVKRSGVWNVLVDDATVGASRLNGVFTYNAERAVPLLSGWLGGNPLSLADLGPAVGTKPAATPQTASTRDKGKVLPDRPFDLPTLNVMDADVLIDIAQVDLNTQYLQPLQALRGHLKLADGVLTLSELDARTGQGRLSGGLSLHGRASQALWKADLRWDEIHLESWIRQAARANGLPPFVSGRLYGRLLVEGQGRSTAEILASLNGHVRSDLRDGEVSHLVLEAAGLDVAQGVAVLLKGDDTLNVQCAVADFSVLEGVVRPNVMVLDTSDTAIRIDGSLSLASEALNVVVVVMPKDASPLTLRTPLKVGGTFANPDVSLERGPLGLKFVVAVVLAQIAPLAVLVPLIDPGDPETAKRDLARCKELMPRKGKRAVGASLH